MMYDNIDEENDDLLDDLVMEMEEEGDVDYGEEGGGMMEEEPEEDNIASFIAYRDRGPEGRIGGRVDDELVINQIEGALHQKLDARSVFSLRLLDDLKMFSMALKLTPNDIKQLKRNVEHLAFPQYTHSEAYILGYYLHQRKAKPSRVAHLKPAVSNAQLIKYTRYWAAQN